jgi:hypothetical protein
MSKPPRHGTVLRKEGPDLEAVIWSMGTPCWINYSSEFGGTANTAGFNEGFCATNSKITVSACLDLCLECLVLVLVKLISFSRVHHIRQIIT